MDPKDADRMANRVDTNQAQSDLGLHCFLIRLILQEQSDRWVYTVCPDLSV